MALAGRASKPRCIPANNNNNNIGQEGPCYGDLLLLLLCCSCSGFAVLVNVHLVRAFKSISGLIHVHTYVVHAPVHNQQQMQVSFFIISCLCFWVLYYAYDVVGGFSYDLIAAKTHTNRITDSQLICHICVCVCGISDIINFICN